MAVQNSNKHSQPAVYQNCRHMVTEYAQQRQLLQKSFKCNQLPPHPTDFKITINVYKFPTLHIAMYEKTCIRNFI
jgi:hypothetical protein